ncbi:hypothetical protein [Actinocorallia herbida]|uniref:hypothetical protein n=1 Tax=Actinocorallia herbida TaxID=58109 RepID=UPI000F4CEA98|nr:hypothetical protein [Actinocorallia herbida]
MTAQPPEIDGEGPWEVSWAWSTGYNGVDRFETVERTVRFVDAIFRKVPTHDGSDLTHFSVRNTLTGESLAQATQREARVSRVVPKLTSSLMNACRTCDGLGVIENIKSGQLKACTRCHSTGRETGGPAVKPIDAGSCGTCGGSGEILIIQTGDKRTCSRCDGTGQE